MAFGAFEPLQKMEPGIVIQQPNFLRRSYGFGGLLVTKLFQILDQCDLTNYDICFVQIGENEVKAAKDDPLGLNYHVCAD